MSHTAYFAARSELVGALRLIAQGLDCEHRTTVHSQSLSAGLTAIKEVQDFLPVGAKLEAEINLPAVVGSHRTPVLKGAAEEELRPLLAVKSYFTFAQQQLAAAAGHEVAGSVALCSLGKLHAALARHKNQEVQLAESKAVVFFQASLLAYPGNHAASNELGVLLARCGQYAAARRALEYSVASFRGSTNLENLAAVYQHLGEQRLAAATRQQAEAVRRAEESRWRLAQLSAGGLVQWVPPSMLSQSAGQLSDVPQTYRAPQPPANANQPTPVVRPTAPAAKSGLSAGTDATPPANKPSLGWLPWPPSQPTSR